MIEALYARHFKFIVKSFLSKSLSKYNFQQRAQNHNQYSNLPDGDALEGVYFSFEFNKFIFDALAAVAENRVF